VKLRVKRNKGKIVMVTVISEDEEDKEVLEALWSRDVSQVRIIYRQGRIVLQAKISPFGRKG